MFYYREQLRQALILPEQSQLCTTMHHRLHQFSLWGSAFELGQELHCLASKVPLDLESK